MKKLKCHCGHEEAEINLPNGLRKLLGATVQFEKEKEQLCFMKD